MGFHGIFQWNIGIYSSGIPVEYWNIPGIWFELRRRPDYSPSSHHPIFDARRVCVCYSFSLFLGFEISEAQRAHAHSARARPKDQNFLV